MMSEGEQVRSRLFPSLVTLGVTVLVLGPLLLKGGIALRGDMVFTPDQPWKPAWLGLSGSVPRAVPMDAVISILDEVLPGAALQRLVLVAAFVLGGLGIARLCKDFGQLAQAAAILVYLWNPWVLERLAIGQWPMVLGYGLLPWLVLALARVRERRAGGWPGMTALLIGCAVCAPSMGLIAVLVATMLTLTPRDTRRSLGVLALGVLANLPWLVPALLGPTLSADQSQFGAFAARGESSLGTLASLLSMGGIWKSSIVPPERTHAFVIAVALMISLACVAGLRLAAHRLGAPTTSAVALVGGACLLIAGLPAIEVVADALGSLSVQVPAVGILRDSQRYLAPLGLVLAIGAAALVERLLDLSRSQRPGFAGLAVLVAVAPVVLLPSLAWGIAGGLRPVSYPADWARVADLVSAQDDGALVVLPWSGNYRGFSWNQRRAVLDPTDRYLPGEVLSDDRLFVGDRVLGSEDAMLAQVGTALAAVDPAEELGALGVRWVLVEKDQQVPDAAIPAGSVAYEGPSLRLVDLGAPTGTVAAHRHEPARWPVLAADSAVLIAVCVSFWQLWPRLVRNQRKDL